MSSSSSSPWLLLWTWKVSREYFTLCPVTWGWDLLCPNGHWNARWLRQRKIIMNRYQAPVVLQWLPWHVFFSSCCRKSRLNQIASQVQRGKAHMRSTPSLISFPEVAVETVPMLVWLTTAFYYFSSSQGRSLTVVFFSLRLFHPGDRWRDGLGFVPAGSVSRSSTLQVFLRRKATCDGLLRLWAVSLSTGSVISLDS